MTFFGNIKVFDHDFLPRCVIATIGQLMSTTGVATFFA
jgi:hypothetical protein